MLSSMHCVFRHGARGGERRRGLELAKKGEGDGIADLETAVAGHRPGLGARRPSRAWRRTILAAPASAAPAAMPPLRKAKTTQLFLTPPGWPNAITADPAARLLGAGAAP